MQLRQVFLWRGLLYLDPLFYTHKHFFYPDEKVKKGLTKDLVEDIPPGYNALVIISYSQANFKGKRCFFERFLFGQYSSIPTYNLKP